MPSHTLIEYLNKIERIKYECKLNCIIIFHTLTLYLLNTLATINIIFLQKLQ